MKTSTLFSQLFMLFFYPITLNSYEPVIDIISNHSKYTIIVTQSENSNLPGIKMTQGFQIYGNNSHDPSENQWDDVDLPDHYKLKHAQLALNNENPIRVFIQAKHPFIYCITYRLGKIGILQNGQIIGDEIIISNHNQRLKLIIHKNKSLSLSIIE